MLYLPNEYSQESSLKICVFKTDRSRWAMRSRRLPNPSPQPATTQGCRRAGVN
jgi:hypothetical protein